MKDFDEILDDADADATQAEVIKAAVELRKRFNFAVVNIIATRAEGGVANGEGQTRRFCGGAGDWYARYGATRMWLLGQEAEGETKGEI